MKKKQSGFGIVEVLLILVIVGIIGFTGWRVYEANKEVSQTPIGNSKIAKEDKKKTEYKQLTVNGYKLKYPVNENNNQVIIEDIGNEYSPAVALLPMRTYFSSSTNPDCKNIIKGLLQVDTVDNLMREIGASEADDDHEANLARINDLSASGRAYKLDADLYILNPSKQNEPCEALYGTPSNEYDENLKKAIADSDLIEKNWLKSIQLDHE